MTKLAVDQILQASFKLEDGTVLEVEFPFDIIDLCEVVNAETPRGTVRVRKSGHFSYVFRSIECFAAALDHKSRPVSSDRKTIEFRRIQAAGTGNKEENGGK